MRRILTTMLAVLLCSAPAIAQAVVIDPSQIAASAINVADQIDYAIDQVSELTNMGDKIGNLKNHLDNVFGEDGLGGKAITLMQDLGTLERLTKAYNSTLSSAARYASVLKDNGRVRVSDANILLSYLTSSRRTAESAVATARKILESLGFSKGEKKAELDRIIRELEEELARMDRVMEVEMEASLISEGLSCFMATIDEGMGSQQYVQTLEAYGDKNAAAGKALGVITLILLMLTAASTIYGYVIYTRGGITGDPTSENVFLRIGVALLGATVVLNILARVFNLNL